MAIGIKIATCTLGFLLSTTSFGQTTTKIDSLTFCSYKFKVPTGCTAESEYGIKCDTYSMNWLYMSKEMSEHSLDQIIEQLSQQFTDFKKEAFTCYLLGNKAKGYKISYELENGTSHQLIAYGTVNGQTVLVQLFSNTELGTNKDIPEFPRQIIRLTE